MQEIFRPARLTLTLTAVAISTVVAMSGLLIWQLRGLELKHAEAEVTGLSQIIAEQTARSVQGIDLALDITLERLGQAEGQGLAIGDFAVHSILRSRVRAMPQLSSIFVADDAGTLLSSAVVHPVPELSVSDRAYFLALKEQRARARYYSAPTRSRLDNARTFFVSRRMPKLGSWPAGIIVAAIDLEGLESLYASMRLDRVSRISLFLDNGAMLASAAADGDNGWSGAASAWLTEVVKGDTALTEQRTHDAGAGAGFVAVSKLSNYPMSIAVGIDDRDALRGWRATVQVILIGTVVSVCLMIVASGLLLRRLRQEERLRARALESSAQLQVMVDTAMDAIVTIGPDSHVVEFNRAAQEMFGYRADEIIGGSIDRLFPARLRSAQGEIIDALQSRAIAAPRPESRIELTGLRADGSEFPVESTFARVRVGGQEMFSATMRDVEHRRRTEEELRESHRQLRELASSLQAIREEERTVIARELHDELGQQLLRLRMDLSWISGRMKSAPPEISDKLTEMKRSVEDVVDTVRKVTSQLRPPLLDELGLVEAVRWQADEFAARSGLKIATSIGIDDRRLGETTTINLFRILQESLTNVGKHAAATEVRISLSEEAGELRMAIEDNGNGLRNPGQRPGGQGLIGIRERVILLGGSVQIDSEPERGFALIVRIPLYREVGGELHS